MPNTTRNPRPRPPFIFRPGVDDPKAKAQQRQADRVADLQQALTEEPHPNPLIHANTLTLLYTLNRRAKRATR